MNGGRTPAPAHVVRLEVPLTFAGIRLDEVQTGLEVVHEPDRRVRTTHWDTADLRLARWGAALEHSADAGWALRIPPTDEGVAAPDGLELHWRGSSTAPPHEALDLIRAFVRHARVEQVARLVTLQRESRLADADGRWFATVGDSTVSVYAGPRITQRFREIEVRTDATAAASLSGLITVAVEAAGGQRTGAPHDVTRALGMAGSASPELVAQRPGPGMAAGDVVRRALTLSVIRLIRHDPGVRLGGHPEDVHQARVATRRLRSDLRTFRPLLDRAWAEGLREELRRLGAELGRVRDAEVLRDRLRASAGNLADADRKAVTAVIAPLGAQARTARRHLLVAMDGDRHLDLIDRLIGAARHPALLDAAAAPAEEALPALLRRPWKVLRDGAAVCRPGVPDDQLHDLRIRAKRCRYAAEAAAPAIGKRAATFAKSVAALQEVLGELHDAVVAEEWLRRRSAAPGLDDLAVFAAGELVALQRSAAQTSRDGWPNAWRRAKASWVRSWG